MPAHMSFEAAPGLPKAIQRVVAHVRLLTKISAAMASVCDWFGPRPSAYANELRGFVLALVSNRPHGLLLGHPVFDVRVSVRAR